MKRSLIIVPIVLLFGCGSDVGETGDISEVLSTFRLSDTDAVSRTNGWLSQGFPFARGAVAAASILGVKDSDGVTVASRFEPLSYWEDGSVRWALLEFATDYAPDSSALFQVVAGEGGTFAPLPPDLPEIRLEVDRGGDGVTSFVLLDGVSAVEDSLEVEA